MKVHVWVRAGCWGSDLKGLAPVTGEITQGLGVSVGVSCYGWKREALAFPNPDMWAAGYRGLRVRSP